MVGRGGVQRREARRARERGGRGESHYQKLITL